MAFSVEINVSSMVKLNMKVQQDFARIRKSGMKLNTITTIKTLRFKKCYRNI